MESCYLELKEAQKNLDDKKEDQILFKCIKCKNFRQNDDGYYCKDKEIRVIKFE